MFQLPVETWIADIFPQVPGKSYKTWQNNRCKFTGLLVLKTIMEHVDSYINNTHNLATKMLHWFLENLILVSMIFCCHLTSLINFFLLYLVPKHTSIVLLFPSFFRLE